MQNVVGYTDLSTENTESRGSWVQDQLELYSQNLSLKGKERANI